MIEDIAGRKFNVTAGKPEPKIEEVKQPAKPEPDLDQVVPTPVGYKILIALPQIDETFKDTEILKVGSTLREEQILSMVGVVMDLGGQAYTDKERFPTGPWCKVGDYVLFRPNSGTRLKILGQEYRIINDDSVEAVVGDPSEITRV